MLFGMQNLLTPEMIRLVAYGFRSVYELPLFQVRTKLVRLLPSPVKLRLLPGLVSLIALKDP